ncbi:MAG: hypothetical protein L6V89_06700 [Oscillospiraceae bacterium]|nr:MAG: hypothetical protein L6V89_06700 [Oscillospiraceae bacterium]
MDIKQVHSLAVKALRVPPMLSIVAAMHLASFVAVPLKSMCSMKWEIPFSSGVS